MLIKPETINDAIINHGQHVPDIARLTPAELQKILLNLHKFSDSEKAQLFEELEILENFKNREKGQKSFLHYAKLAWPELLVGPHHRIFAKKFEEIASKGGRRIIINIAPRHGKSLFSSHLFPAWFLGKFPEKKVIQTSHTAELAVEFGRKVRNLFEEAFFQNIFPGSRLSADSKAAGRWATNKGGEYFALGVGGAMAGKGADLLIIDDPHSEQEAKTGNPEVFDPVYEWYQSGPRQRLQPNGSIILIQTRWSKRDLTGRLIDVMTRIPDADQWEVIELPMELPSGEPLWPEFWSKDDIKALKGSLDIRYWNAQYQQNPTSEEGALIKREWWKVWKEEDPPECDYIILSIDTAHEKNNRADYSAFTIWGVFYREGDSGPEKGKGVPNIILLEAFKDRMEFPELKARSFETWKDWQPDAFVVEKKAAGAPLVQEFRRMGIPVQEFSPSKGQDKVARVNSVSDMFRSGMVWAPETRWAQAVIEECAEFPAGSHDDYVDSMSAALMRFRQGNFVTLPSDYQDTMQDKWNLMRKAEYY